MNNDILKLGNKQFKNRLIIGTGKFSDWQQIPEVIRTSDAEMVTVALRRVDFTSNDLNILDYIPKGVTLLPNTSGATSAKEAIRIARIAREAGCGDFIKIEVIPEHKYLMPDNYQTLEATEVLAKEGFIVLPYVLPDPVLCRQFSDAGAAAIMPLGAPIGTNKGLTTKILIEMMLEYSTLPVIVDAGIGAPSHAAEAMELGVAAILTDTAIASSNNPVMMAHAMKLAVEAGRKAYLAGLGAISQQAIPSSPLTGFLR